ncbi:MAG: TIGR02301 family protein [Alphaproteobacteria bacterium]|nr:TIGR02301 family protein [Alphaproteobacteria bacterium]
MRIRARAAAVLLSLAAATASAVAQDRGRTPEEGYEAQLVELATVLGRAHYLRITCNGRQDARWRTYVRHMISQESDYRSEITRSFNDGYRLEEARFPFCDSEAVQMESELRAQGLRLAQGLSVRNAGERAEEGE